MNEKELIPYIIVFFCFFLLIVLLYSRYLLTKREIEVEIEIGNGQTIGTREEQDDSFATMTTSVGTIAVLADGISGLSNGKMASMLTVNTFLNEFSKLNIDDNIQSFFSTTALLANREITQNLKGSGGGTTLASVIIDQNGYLHWGAVGDSLITIFRDGDFIRVNQKDIYENVLEERYLSGEMTINEIKTNPMRKRLINYLGFTGFKNIEIGNKAIRLMKKDKVFLCSDGVSDSLTEVEIENILSKEISPYDAAQEIIEVIEEKQLKSQDNATVVILANGW
ncbi:MAG TPA: serine/threonine-protein phosphatase [Bacillales bacterium]|nr:serine/threonine-protein phosphatase [Bacillales bacterium]